MAMKSADASTSELNRRSSCSATLRSEMSRCTVAISWTSPGSGSRIVNVEATTGIAGPPRWSRSDDSPSQWPRLSTSGCRTFRHTSIASSVR